MRLTGRKTRPKGNVILAKSIRLHLQGREWLSVKSDPPVTVPVGAMMLLAKITLRQFSQNSGLQAVGIHRQPIYKNKQQFRQSSVSI